MKICVVGSGYVGLVTGACLADFGMHVVGVDKDAGKVESLGKGQVPIYEPGLATLVKKNMREGRLCFTTELGPAIEEAAAIFIAVGTPPLADGSADLTFIREVASSIAGHLNCYKVIVTKSTVPIGTGKMIDDLGLKGTRRGGAVVSPKHANFIVTEGDDARASDALALAEEIRERVKQEHGIDLEYEVELWSSK